METEFEVLIYKTADGKEPLGDFLSTTDPKTYAKFLMEADLLQKHGNRLTMPYSKHLRDGIFELRIQAGGNIARVLYFFVSGRKIILTHGFAKKTKKTPKKEIDRAIACKAEWEGRNESKKPQPAEKGSPEKR